MASILAGAIAQAVMASKIAAAKKVLDQAKSDLDDAIRAGKQLAKERTLVTKALMQMSAVV